MQVALYPGRKIDIALPAMVIFIIDKSNNEELKRYFILPKSFICLLEMFFLNLATNNCWSLSATIQSSSSFKAFWLACSHGR